MLTKPELLMRLYATSQQGAFPNTEVDTHTVKDGNKDLDDGGGCALKHTHGVS